jgi:predicted small secreted protein
MALNFNVQPYYDDFDPNKNFHRILFKPGAAVQARELTQSQTIMQDQISKFASSVFSQNTPVSGGKITTNLYCHYIKLASTYQGASITASKFLNKIITDTATGTIVAKVIATSEATGFGTIGDPPTLIVSYISGTMFTDSDDLIALGGSNFAATVQTSSDTDKSTGVSSVASISEGVFYVVNGYNISNTQNSDGSYSKYSIGNFVSVAPQIVILDKYSNTPSYRVGLEIVETINDYVDDTSLLDPAVGASNYQAPGADRYVVKLNLTTLPLQVGNDDAFIELIRLNNGSIIKQVDSTVYSTIDDYFAKRTYDTNGDYVVNPFKLTPATNLDDTSKFDIGIGKGVAYVRGYRLENQSQLTVTGDRARSYDTLTNNNVSIDFGNFLYVDNVKGSSTGTFQITTMPSIDLHSVPSANIVSTNLTTYSSTLVGTAKIRDLVFDHYANTSSDTTSYTYKAYICDIKTNTLSSNVTSATSTTISFYDPSGKFSTKDGAYVGVSITIDSGSSVGDSRTITAYNGSTKTATVNQAFSITPTTTSNFSLRFSTRDIETLISVNSTYGIVSSANISTTGKVNNLSTGYTILQDAGYPELLYKIGNPYVKTISDASYTSTNYFRNKSFNAVSGGVQCQIQFDASDINELNFNGRTGVALSASEILNYFTVIVRTVGSNGGLIVGQILDFTSANRTVTISDNKNIVTFFASDLSAATTFSVDVIAKVYVENADDTGHVAKVKNLIQTNATVASNTNGTVVNTNTYVNLTAGQVYIANAGLVSPGQTQSLYVCDVKRIVKIIDTGSSAILPTVSMLSNSSYDVTSYYAFNSGQTDNYYDHAYLTLRPGAPTTKGNLLVLFDYYSHSGGDGYFNINSYINSTNPESYTSIPNYTATNGTIYQLRDCLDFRPSRLNATSTFAFRYTNSDVVNTDTGIYIPQSLTTFVSNYSYYLARKDLLILTKDRQFQIISGVASINPVFPAQPDGSLIVAKMNLDPYTGYIPGENPTGSLPNLSIEPVQHKRWTMQDISDLQTRINNLEYYTALNTLEQQTSSMQVPDVNGLNRFKNGILVDDFSSFATADTSNPDWSASINKRTRQLTATQNVSNFPLQNPSVVTTNGKFTSDLFSLSNVNKTTNIFTLPYTPVSVITQQLASNTVNLNPFAVTISQGTLDINPPMDNWVDNTKAPDLLIVDPTLQVFQQTDSVNVLSAGDWKAIQGTAIQSSSTQTSSSFSVSNHGAFNGPFGSNIGYTETNTTTTTQTYGLKGQTNVLGYYQNINNTYSLNNNYIQDISVIPYIRPQELLIRAKGLLINSPITTFFDGVDVSSYITQPDIIELTGVSGSFNQDDVIGYKDNNVFYPIATIVSVYNYPGTTNTRLYVVGNFHSKYYTSANLSNPTIQSVIYDASGNIVSYPASGNAQTSNIITVHKSSQISAVGGNFTDVIGSSLKYYRISGTTFGGFVAKYGIWGSPTLSGDLSAGTFNITAPKAGTYYMRYAIGFSQQGYIKVNNSYVVGTSSSSPMTATYATDLAISLNAGVNTISFYQHKTDTAQNAWFAIAVSTSSWSGSYWGNYNSGSILFSTDALKATSVPYNSGTEIQMPGGGLYYVGATQISLNGIGSSIDNFYNGCKISITATFVSTDVYGNILPTVTKTSIATITGYTALGCICTLDTPVDVSIGFNTLVNADITSAYSINGTHTNYTVGVQSGGLSKLSTDESGTFVGVFKIPQGTFKTGDRVFRIDNRTTLNDAGSATCFAEGTFTASGLATQSQALNFGPSVSGAKSTFTQTNYLANQLLSTSTTVVKSYAPYDPIAQSFLISKENYPNGIFLDSVDFFFASKPTTNDPITLSIVQTLNGYPNGQTLDYSVVTLTGDKIKSSKTPHYLDPTAKTTFKFQAPVYIQPGVMYAFILKTQSTGYDIYLAAQNAVAVPSSVKVNYTDPTPTTITKIGAVPGIGGLFESQNGTTWTAEQSKTLMMNINRCNFDTSVNPVIPFTIPANLPYRKSTSGDIRYLTDPNNVSSVSNPIAGSDVLCDAFNVTTTDFTPTTTGIVYNYSATLNNGYTSTPFISLSPGKYGCPTFDDIYLSDGNGERVLLANSSNSFELNATLSSSDSAVSPILSDDGLSLYNIQWSINNLQLSNTQISIINGGSGYNGTPNCNVSISSPDITGGVNAIAAANVVSGVVQSIYLTNPGSGYLNPPTITVSGANTTPVQFSVTSEFSPHGGNAQCKYFTKKVVMAAGNDSQDLRVFYTAYKPIGTNIFVFYKLLSSSDTAKFDDNGWQLMTTIGQNSNIYSKTRSDLYEYEAAPGSNGIAANYIKYTNVNGQSFDSFIQFAIKVVITTSDNTTVPFLTDLRAIALPSGTGL